MSPFILPHIFVFTLDHNEFLFSFFFFFFFLVFFVIFGMPFRLPISSFDVRTILWWPRGFGTKTRWINTGWKYLAISMISVSTAMLCKEQGITVTAICAVYEIFVVQKVSYWCNTLLSFSIDYYESSIDFIIIVIVIVKCLSILLRNFNQTTIVNHESWAQKV